jgi:hypothetical protein
LNDTKAVGRRFSKRRLYVNQFRIVFTDGLENLIFITKVNQRRLTLWGL